MTKLEKQENKLFRLFAKALGEKSGKTNREADQIAFIRILITLQILITNFFIIFGVIRTHIFPSQINNQKCQIHENVSTIL